MSPSAQYTMSGSPSTRTARCIERTMAPRATTTSFSASARAASRPPRASPASRSARSSVVYLPETTSASAASNVSFVTAVRKPRRPRFTPRRAMPSGASARARPRPGAPPRAAPADGPAPRLELRLHERDDVAAVPEERERRREHQTQRDERDVRDDEIDTLRDGDALARVDALVQRHTRIAP